MKKRAIYKIILSSFLLFAHIIGYGNVYPKEHAEQLLKSGRKELSDKNYLKAIEICNEVQLLAEKNNWNILQIKALNDMGIAYRIISDYDKAMECYLDAYKIALKISDQKGEIVLLNNIADLYSMDQKLSQAKEYYQKALVIAKEMGDTLLRATLYVNLSDIASDENNLDLAEEYIDLGLLLFKSKATKGALFEAQITKAKIFYKKQEYFSAEKVILDVLKEHEGEIEKFKHSVSFFLLASRIYQEQNKQEEALYYAKHALECDPTLEEYINIYERLSDHYRVNNSAALAWAYNDSVMLMKDSLYKMNIKENLETNRVRFKLLNSERDLSENKAKQKAERILFISILIFIIILAVILIWVLRIQSIRNKQGKQITELELEKEKNKKQILEQETKEKETLALLEQERLNIEKLRLKQQLKEQEALNLLEKERLQNEVNEKLLLKQRMKEQEIERILEQERLNNEKLLLAQQLKEQETLALLKQEKLNNEIDAKNRQLTAKILSHTNRHEWLNEILQSLLKIPEKSRDTVLNSIIWDLKIQLKDSSEWDTFLNHFEEMNPSLLMALKNKSPNLTANDIQLISCIYLDLDTKKIAHLLNVSTDACWKKKQRLANKMGITASKLRDYFKNIEKYPS